VAAGKVHTHAQSGEKKTKRKKVGSGFVEKKNFAKIWNLGLLKKH
jgi:hypothetical protein